MGCARAPGMQGDSKKDSSRALAWAVEVMDDGAISQDLGDWEEVGPGPQACGLDQA